MPTRRCGFESQRLDTFDVQQEHGISPVLAVVLETRQGTEPLQRALSPTDLDGRDFAMSRGASVLSL